MRGLGLLDVLLCPHYDSGPGRQDALRRLVPRTGLVGIGLDDCAGFEVLDDRYRILSCRHGSTAHLVDRAGAQVDLVAESRLRPLSDLQ